MTAEEHNKTLSTLWFVYGAMHGLTLLVLLLFALVARLALMEGNEIPGSWLAAGIAIFVVLMLAVGLLPLLLGYGFRRRTQSTRALGIALAIVSLVNIPLGTALGIYTLKFFKSEGGVLLYGGRAGTTDDAELQQAMRGAQPLMNWAKKVKESE